MSWIPQSDEEEEAAKERYRARYRAVGLGICVLGLIGGVFVFSLQRVFLSGSLQPTATVAVLLDGMLGAGFATRKRPVLAGICFAGALLTYLYLPNAIVK